MLDDQLFTGIKRVFTVVAIGVVVAAFGLLAQGGGSPSASQGNPSQPTSSAPLSASCRTHVRNLASATADATRLPVLVLDRKGVVVDVLDDLVNDRVSQATLDRNLEGQGDIPTVARSIADAFRAAVPCFEELERAANESCAAVPSRSENLMAGLSSLLQAGNEFEAYVLEILQVYGTLRVIGFDFDGFEASGAELLRQAREFGTVATPAQRSIALCITAIN